MIALLVLLFAAVAVGLWAVSHTFSLGHSGGSVSLSDVVTVTGEIAAEASITVPAAATNQAEAIAFDQPTLQGIYIKSDQAVTLKTNASGAPQETIALAANVPFVWYAGGGIANPFAGDVTNTFWTNAGATAANVYVRVLVS